MMRNTAETYKDMGKELESFFNRYLVAERGVSQHTIRSYRDAFVLLIEYFESVKKIKPERLSLEAFSKDNINGYLDWLEDKGCSSTTRNIRCAAVKSFVRYLIYTDPAHMSQWQSVVSIKAKRSTKETIKYLTVEGMTKLLESIDLSTSRGRRDHTILSVLYYTGARAQELADLTPSSIRTSEPYLAELFGKGSKKRCVPLDEDIFNLIMAYMREHGLDRPENNKHPLFYNTWGGKLTTAGLTYIIEKHVKPAKIAYPELFTGNISPHSFRHSRAMHLLQSGVSLIIIRDILGHVSIQTTEIYARVDSKLKRDAIAKAYNAVGKVEPAVTSWEKDPKLKAFLKGLV
jgi:site-specific recombinase XerD